MPRGIPPLPNPNDGPFQREPDSTLPGGVNGLPNQGEESGISLPGLFALFGKLFKENPKAAKAITGVVGSLVAAELNKPSQASKDAQAGLNRAANAQASDVEANVRRKSELESLIKGLQPLSGQAKNDLIRLYPGKQTDFSGVRGTGDISLLMQLAGLGAPSGLVGQAGALANQQDIFGQDQTSNTVAALVELLLGLGSGQPSEVT